MTYLSTAHSVIIQSSFQRGSKNMAAIGSTGTSMEIKEEYEKMKSLKNYCRVKIGGDVE